MLDNLGRSLSLSLAPGRMVLVQHSGWRKRSAEVLGRWQGGAPSDPEAELPQQLDSLLAQAGVVGMPVRMLVADSLVRSWTVQPPENASRLQDCEAAVAMRFTEVFGDSLADWHIRADYDPRHAFMACALRRSLLAGLLRPLQARRLTLLSLEPECVALWNHWARDLPEAGWFGICNAGSLLLGIVAEGRLQGTRRLALAGAQAQSSPWLEQAVAREAARLNVATPKAIGLCGTFPRAWAEAGGAALRCRNLGSICDASGLLGVQA